MRVLYKDWNIPNVCWNHSNSNDSFLLRYHYESLDMVLFVNLRRSFSKDLPFSKASRRSRAQGKPDFPSALLIFSYICLIWSFSWDSNNWIHILVHSLSNVKFENIWNKCNKKILLRSFAFKDLLNTTEKNDLSQINRSVIWEMRNLTDATQNLAQERTGFVQKLGLGNPITCDYKCK